MADSDVKLIASTASMSPNEALSVLLELWRRRPIPELADLIDDVGASVERPSIKARTQRETSKAFLELAREPDDAALGSLLEVFPVGTMKSGFAQMVALSRWPADPRLAAELLALFDDPPYRSRPALEFWNTLLATVERMADPRSAAVVSDLIGRMEQTFAQPMRKLMGEALSELLPSLPLPAETTDEDLARAIRERRAALQAPVSSIGTAAEELLSAVFADPTDDELRLIYADACAAAGDPRGELIMIGHLRESGKRLSKEQRQREKALLDEHREDWLGDFDKVLLKSSIKFRLGFLEAATIKPKHDAHVRPLIGDLRWATVRDLEIKAVSDYHDESAAGARASVEELVLHPAMRGLRRLTGDLSPTLVVELCEGSRTRPLETIFATLWGDRSVAEVRAALATASRLPALTELILRHNGRVDPADYGWLFDGPIGERLSRLELRVGLSATHRWHPVFVRSSLESLSIRDSWGRSRVDFRRHGETIDLRAHSRWPGSSDGGLLTLAELIAALPPGSIDAVDLSWTRSSKATDKQRSALETSLEKLAPRVIKLPKR